MKLVASIRDLEPRNVPYGGTVVDFKHEFKTASPDIICSIRFCIKRGHPCPSEREFLRESLSPLYSQSNWTSNKRVPFSHGNGKYTMPPIQSTYWAAGQMYESALTYRLAEELCDKVDIGELDWMETTTSVTDHKYYMTKLLDMMSIDESGIHLEIDPFEYYSGDSLNALSRVPQENPVRPSFTDMLYALSHRIITKKI